MLFVSTNQRATTQIWVERHQYGISALVTSTSFSQQPVTRERKIVGFLKLNKHQHTKRLVL